MIRDELNTGFRWYDDIEKQSRYKDSCKAVCDYKRLTPLHKILPFQIYIPASLTEVYTWYIRIACDDSLAFDLTPYFSFLQVWTIDGTDRIIYEGNNIPELIDLPCGDYYCEIETNNGTFFSEVFTSQDISDPAFSQIDFPLFTVWRFYDNQLKENRFKKYCEAICDQYLLSGNDALIPFMFRKPHTVGNVVNSWILRSLDGTCTTLLDTSKIHITLRDGFDYVYYLGDALSGLPCGVYECVITVNNIAYYSEPINIINTISSNGSDTNYLLQENGDPILLETTEIILLE